MNPAIGIVFVLIAGFTLVMVMPAITESVDNVQQDATIDEGTQTLSGLMPIAIFISLLLALFFIINYSGGGA